VTITEKQSKYQDVAFEIEQHWQVNNTTAIPSVLSAARIIPDILKQSLGTLNLPPRPVICLFCGKYAIMIIPLTAKSTNNVISIIDFDIRFSFRLERVQVFYCIK